MNRNFSCSLATGTFDNFLRAMMPAFPMIRLIQFHIVQDHMNRKLFKESSSVRNDHGKCNNTVILRASTELQLIQIPFGP
mmetsp:Transcript_15626/g.24302  ORF Transcript_15626/g.24302 Transcript_15626/m.24302 type:complete len:80 (-) Transcript_15626:62-301(-)